MKAVYDLAIAYQRVDGAEGWMQAPTMWDTLSLPKLGEPGPRTVAGGSIYGVLKEIDKVNGASAPATGGRANLKAGGWRFHVHARRFLLEELPYDDEGLAKWLEQRWVEKGEWLEAKRLEWAREGVPN